MSIFLGLSERYQSALETLDPLRGEWLMRLIDPWPNERNDGKIFWLRIVIFLLLLLTPPWIFSAIPSTTCGGKLVGAGSISADVGLHAIYFYIVSYVVLLLITRRLLGDLINELVERGIVSADFRKFDLRNPPNGMVLRALKWLSKVDVYHIILWLVIIAIVQKHGYHVFLIDGKPTWHTSPAEPGTLFYFLRAGNEQPNLAGLWDFFVVGFVQIYLVVPSARLAVVFACICSEIAGRKELVIIPTHPDGTGGLRPIGQVALLFWLLVFVLGVCMTGMATNELIYKSAYHSSSYYANSNLHALLLVWGLYILLGSLLFFLPLLPIHARMVKDKRRFLLEAMKRFDELELKHRTELREK
jgi:hypothetical protein